MSQQPRLKYLRDFMIDVYQTTQHDFYVVAEYVSDKSYRVYVQRLDTDNCDGWDFDLQLLLFSPIHGYSERISIGPSDTSEKIQLFDLQSETIVLEPEDAADPIDPVGSPSIHRKYIPRMSEPNYQQIDCRTFNSLFDAEMVTLPECFYAVGIKNGETYIYSEKYSLYWEIAPTMRFLVNILYDRVSTHPTQYFVICACDGFPEYAPYKIRTEAIMIDDPNKYKGIFTPTLLDIADDQYEIFHKNRWILCQNNHMCDAYPYTIPMPDHHYFVMNAYREFRWIHEGQPWDDKIPQIVFAGSPERSSKYNFGHSPLVDSEPDITQRQYFYRQFENHPNVVAIQSGWLHPNFVPRENQTKYKYILDMDGLASTWDSLAWKMRSGSVIFRVGGIWNQWFSPQFLAGVHFVPIKPDFSDLMEKYEWCQSHPAECKQMILAACRVFDEIYRLQNADNYVREKVLQVI